MFPALDAIHFDSSDAGRLTAILLLATLPANTECSCSGGTHRSTCTVSTASMCCTSWKLGALNTKIASSGDAGGHQVVRGRVAYQYPQGRTIGCPAVQNPVQPQHTACEEPSTGTRPNKDLNRHTLTSVQRQQAHLQAVTAAAGKWCVTVS